MNCWIVAETVIRHSRVQPNWLINAPAGTTWSWLFKIIFLVVGNYFNGKRRDGLQKTEIRARTSGAIRCWPVSVRNLSAVFGGSKFITLGTHLLSSNKMIISTKTNRLRKLIKKDFPVHLWHLCLLWHASHNSLFGNKVRYYVIIAPGKLLDNALISIKLYAIRP